MNLRSCCISLVNSVKRHGTFSGVRWIGT